MKKLKITLMCAAVSFVTSQSGICAMIVGNLTPSSLNPAGETGAVQTLVGMGANQTLVQSGITYTTFAYDAPNVPIVFGFKIEADTPNGFTYQPSIMGYQFALGKYGQTSWVWELASGETFDIPLVYPERGNGLSHYSVFNATTQRVPDGGTSIALLGMALLGLGGARKVLGKH